MHPSIHLLSVLFLATPALAATGHSRDLPLSPAGLGSDANWLDTPFFHVGPDDEVFSSMVLNGDLVISGRFTTVAHQVAPSVARWDGNQWIGYPGLGTGGLLTQFNGQLTVVRGWPIGDGSYTQYEVDSWNGSGWDASPTIFQFVGSDPTNVRRFPESVAVLDDTLYMTPEASGAGFFDFSEGGNTSMARWDGTAWSGMSSLPADTRHFILAVHDNRLFASGVVTPSYDRIIDSWDGVSWSRTFSTTAQYDVFDMDEHLGELYAARASDGVLKWDGSTWSTFGSAIDALQLASTGSHLAVSTWNDVQEWDGSAWNQLNGLQGQANDLTWTPDGLVAVGPSPLEGFVSVFDGTTWQVPGDPNGRGLAGEVNALLPVDGRLMVGGRFIYPGSNGTVETAAWDGAAWETLRPSVSNFERARSMTAYDGHLVVGYAGYGGSARIDEWNGTGWNTLGTGSGEVRALTVYNGNLLAGGTFYTMDGLPVNYIAAWDGVAWADLQGGVDAPAPRSVDALAVWNGLLVVGGNFTSAGGKSISYLASWSGSQWKDLEPAGNLPPVVTGPVLALAVYDGNLVASGSFWGTDHIAAWDGHHWNPLGGGVTGAPRALVSTGGYLIASGDDVSSAGGVPVNRIAAWDGTAWNAMGSGLEYPRARGTGGGWAFAEYLSVLYVGGNFRTAGGKVSNHLATWAAPTLAVGDGKPETPTFAVKPGLPNPCRTSTRIPFSMPAAGRVVAEVFDVTGRNLGTIQDREFGAGDHAIPWSPRAMRTPSGSTLPGGTYFIRVNALGTSRTQKVVYLP